MKKVALGIEINNSTGHCVLNGVLKYVSTHSQWNVKIFSYPEILSAEAIRNVQKDGFDGIVASCVVDDETAIELKKAPVPLSLIDIHHPLLQHRRRNTTFIENRNDIVGALGAKKFLSLGKFRSFVFISHPNNPSWSQDREFGFVDELKQHHVTPIVLSESFIDTLLKLPRPIAVMAAWDYKAIEVLENCREHGLRVPDDVSVIGVDADPLICGFTHPPLSSVAPNFERLGYCAAAALDAMMAGRKTKSPNTIFCRPKGLVERASTCFLPPAAALILNAKAIIERDAIHGLTVQDLATRLGVSQQLLSLRFRQLEKKSVRDTILDTRLERVRAKLKQQYSDLSSIAEECGFNSANRLSHLFKQRFGISPGAFSRQSRTSAAE